MGDIAAVLGQVFDTFGCQSQQIVDGVFKVLKLGRTTDKLEAKSLEALVAVVLGGVPVKDRPKAVFDAFDTNGDGTFDIKECVVLFTDLAALGESLAHCTATAVATFLVNHIVPAAVGSLFHFVSEDKKELKLINMWIILAWVTRADACEMIAKEQLGDKYEEQSKAVVDRVKNINPDRQEDDGRKIMNEVAAQFMTHLVATCK